MPFNFASGTQGILASWELNAIPQAVQGVSGWAVQSGAVTFSSGLIFNFAAAAAGDYTVNSVVGSAISGSTVTLNAQDPTNPRVDLIVTTSAGSVSALPGTPAAMTATSGPVPPTPSASQLPIARIFVPASGTALSAASITDHRAPLVVPAVALASSSSAATSTTSTSAVDLVTISSLNIAVGTPVRIEANWRKQALAANFVGFGLKVNATTVYECGSTTSTLCSTASNRTEDGLMIFGIGPRSSANYLTGWYSMWVDNISATAASAATPTLGPIVGNGSAGLPNAAITSISIRGKNDTASNAAEITSMRILTGIM